MNILEINTEKGWRGGERQTFYLLQGFRDAGVQVSLLCREGSLMEQKARSLGIPVFTVSSATELLFFLAFRTGPYSLLHAQTGKSHDFAVFSKLLHGKKVIYTRRVDFPVKNFLKSMIYRRTDLVVAISEAIKKIILQRVDIPIEVIPSVVKEVPSDKIKRGELQKRYPNKKIIATVSALVEHKDPLTMIKAVHKLWRMRKDFVFLHFGSGKMESLMREEIEKAGLEQAYILMGYMKDVERHYCDFSLFVMSSKEEGLGSSVLDAFVNAVPVLTTDAGGLKETVSERGELCPAGDADCLAQSMNTILNKSTEPHWQRKLQSVRDEVRQKYSLESSVKKYLGLFTAFSDF